MNQYCQATDVQAVLGLSAANFATDSAFIDQLIIQAQAAIDAELEHSFQSGTATNVYDGHDTGKLYIGECSAFTQVIELVRSTMYIPNGQGGYITQEMIVSSNDITSDCILGPNNRVPGLYLRRLSGLPFFPGVQNYTVAGTFGNATIPADISRATARLAGHWYRMRDTSYADSTQAQGGIRVKYEKQMPPDVLEILARRKRHIFKTRTD